MGTPWEHSKPCRLARLEAACFNKMYVWKLTFLCAVRTHQRLHKAPTLVSAPLVDKPTPRCHSVSGTLCFALTSCERCPCLYRKLFPNHAEAYGVQSLNRKLLGFSEIHIQSLPQIDLDIGRRIGCISVGVHKSLLFENCLLQYNIASCIQ